jgi:16S rRNA (adenine1518-N6/adenine1519-N6)-dimethyltransferase
MMFVRPKKHLGQHFLIDKNISEKIAAQFTGHNGCFRVIEVGPGTGALTNPLMKRGDLELYLMEVDTESIDFLIKAYPTYTKKILQEDFLRADLGAIMGEEPFSVVGNFPYNISSQILFKCLDYRHQIPEIMGMFQKEVAVRIAEAPGSKDYGIISVLLQTFYTINYCFTVDEQAFNPPPKVKSGVIRCLRNERTSLPCSEKLFIRVVKTAFNQRRKTMRNSLKSLTNGKELPPQFSGQRPERLSVDEFIELTQFIESECLS